MMKYFLILVLSLFFAPAHAQDVTVPDSVARWFLEKNQERLVLKQRVTTLDNEIESLKAEVKNLDKTVDTYERDAKTYKDNIQLKEDEKKDLQGQIKHLEGEIRKQVFLKWVGFGTAIFVIVLTLVYGHF